MSAKQEMSRTATKTRRKAAATAKTNRKAPRQPVPRMSTKAKGTKNKGLTKKKRKLVGGDKRLLGKQWLRWIAPAETAIIAEDAPSSYFMIRNLGPAMVEVRCPRQDLNMLMKGKFTILPARGRIIVENLEEESALVEVEFMPKHR